MKTKIFALIISILCLSLIFVACDEEKKCETHVDENTDGACDVCGEAVEKETEPETKPACETHADADADKICDACGLAIVTVVEQLPAEEETRVEMVVSPIPDAAANEYINTTLPEKEFISAAEERNGIVDIRGKYAYIVKAGTNPNTFTPDTEDKLNVYSLVDLESGETLWSGEEAYTNNNTTHVTYSVSMSENWYKVTLNSEVSLVISPTIEYFTYGGDRLGKTADTDSLAPSPELWSEAIADARITYVSYQDTIYAIDKESGKIIHSGNPDTFVYRPVMDEVVGDVGYIWKNNTLYLYDLTEWIECSYSYEIPAGEFSIGHYVLANGNVLVCKYKTLADVAKSYDVILDGKKTDLIYTIVDVKTNETKNVEFGYVITSVTAVDPEDAKYTDTANGCNIAKVNPIVDGYVNINETLTLVIDNAEGEITKIEGKNGFNILCELDGEMRLVDDDRFIKEVTVGGTTLNELVDSTGKHIGYVSGTTYAGYKVVNGKHYAYDNGDPIVDFDEYDNNDNNFHGDYYYLYKTIDVLDDAGAPTGEFTYEKYIYAPGTDEAPRKLDLGTADAPKSLDCRDYIYTISYDVVDGETTTTTCEIYSANGTKILTLTNESISSTDEINGWLTIVTSNGDTYILK